MSKLIKVVVNADDGEVKLRVEAKIIAGAKSLLVQDEIDWVAKKLGRMLADAVRSLDHTDFGPDNTTISIV